MYKKIFLACIVCCSALQALSAAERYKHIVIETSGNQISDAELIAIERISKSGPIRINVVPKGSGQKYYDLKLVLGTPSSFSMYGETRLKKPDSWVLKTLPGKPVTVLCLGQNNRGMLYAAYQLADLLSSGQDIENLNQFFEPRISQRYVSFGATLYGRQTYQPAQYQRTLEELPRYGYNGVLIYPGGGTPIGRQASPVLETPEGRLYMDEKNTRRWNSWFDDLKRYDHDIIMTIPPVIPMGYTHEQVQRFYQGGPEPAGFTDSLKGHFKQFLTLLTQAYPEIDSYMFNSTEGATFGRNERFFGAPGAQFSGKKYLANNAKVMTAYFDVLSDFFKGRLDQVSFWTHSFGLTSEGIVTMREILFNYPEITIIEDDYWNNNLWPHDLPSMNYLPEDLRANIHIKNPFGLFQIATDGEYYGGGSVPNAYAGSHIRSAADALDRKAKLVIQRLDLHDRTPYGTLFGTMEVVPMISSAQFWSPTLPENSIWSKWADRRFGHTAAPYVINALKTSKTIIEKGLSANGADLLAVGSEFNPRSWKMGTEVKHFDLFGRPGQLIVQKTAKDVIKSTEYTKYQMKTRSIAIGDYLKNMKEAQHAIAFGISEIEKAKSYLDKNDYEMLSETFGNGKNVITGLTLLGKLAYAANIVKDNYDKVKHPADQFSAATREMEEFIDSKLLIPSMNDNLREILNDYQQNLESKLKTRKN